MKLLKKCFLLVICAMGLITIASCDNDTPVYHTVEFNSNGGSTVSSQQVKTGDKAFEPETPTLKWYDFIGWYSDEALTVKFSFETLITKNTTLYAKWQQQDVENVIEILDVEKPSDLLLYESNRKEKDNKRTEFKDLTQEYLVGDDNPWIFKPEVSFISVDPITDDWEEITIVEWNYVINVAILRDTQYQLLTDENVNDYIDSINAKNASVDFSNKAIGNRFKVTVYPEGLTEEQIANISDYTITVEIMVVDGYNAYTALDLAYIENREDTDEALAWKAFKEEKGLDVNYHPTRIIFHKDIKVTTEDLPKFFFYQETDTDLKPTDADYQRTLGSMKDYKSLYYRDVKDASQFTISGNYFQLSIASLPVVTREDGRITAEGEVISHTTLLRFQGSESGKTAIENISIVGNAPRVENKLKAGGTIFIKVEGPEFKAYNNIATSSFIVYMPNYTLTKFTMEKCKAFDSFNCFVYNWGSDKVYMIDCEMKDAGGPVIIQDHVDHETDGSGGRIAETTIINCDLESYVNGSEGWFTIVKASALVAPIVGMDALFNPFGKSILAKNTTNDYNYFNFICINKSGSSASPTAVKIQGTLKIDEYPAFDYGKTVDEVKLVSTIASQFSAPYFQTTAGGVAWTDAKTGLFSTDLSSGQPTQIINPADPIYSGDYIGLYYNGMMIVFGYGSVGNTYTPIG